nr:uncharacterized protein LOC112210301 [Halyomorpha halys]
MEKTDIRAVIKYFEKKGMRAKEIHADYQETLGNSAPSYSTIAKWTSQFKLCRKSLDVLDGQKVLGPQISSQMPRLLTLDHKRTRLEMSKQNLVRFQHNQQDCLRMFMATDETWVYYYTPETK